MDMNEEKVRLILVLVALSLSFVILDIVFLDRKVIAAALFPDILFTAVCLTGMFHRQAPELKRDCIQIGLASVCIVSMMPFWPMHPMGMPFKAVVSPFMIVAMMVCESLVGDMRRYSKVSRLFRNEAIWLNAIRDSRSFYFSMAMCLACLDFLSLCRAGDGSYLLGIVADALALVLLCLGAARLLADHTMYMSKSHEDELKSLLRGNLRTREVAEGVKERKMKALYKKVLDYFEEKKPYLDEEVSLDDISRCLYTNKAYLSKTVNVLSGQNFRQFVNYYRVEYAIELIRRDPHLKVEELAMMSGFHNTVSFNMAFRLFKGKTPSEWIHEHRASLR